MSTQGRIEAAVDLAVMDAREPRSAPADGRPRTVHVAIGDPQAPLTTFLALLDAHGLLGDDGRLKPEVALTSIGDHFDYGPPGWRRFATDEGMQLLSWLAAHPADQVTLILGNHDLGRVAELYAFDQPTYERARQDADRAYNRGERIEALQNAFRGRWPQVHDSEILARDFSSFSVRQRGLVELLLGEHRFRLAVAHSDRVLLIHAGVTKSDLDAIGSTATDARSIAAALDAFLVGALGRQKTGPLSLEPLQRPGSAGAGESRGLLSHRPAHPTRATAEQLEGPPKRRYDPRDLPANVTQVIGHIRDGKCRDLLGEWAANEPERDGALRSMTVEGQTVRYARGTVKNAAMIFIDGGMNYAPVSEYELLDLDTLAALPRVSP